MQADMLVSCNEVCSSVTAQREAMTGMVGHEGQQSVRTSQASLLDWEQSQMMNGADAQIDGKQGGWGIQRRACSWCRPVAGKAPVC